MSIDLTARRRYEAVFRAMRRTSNVGLWLCVGATAILAGSYVVWLAAPIGRMLANTGLPLWLAAAIGTAVPLAVLVSLPNAAQLLVIHGDTKAALEAFNAFSIAEATRRQRDGLPLPRIRNAEQILPWLAANPDADGPLQVRLLTWLGDVVAARAMLEHMQIVTTTDAFEHALLDALVTFIATGSGELGRAREAVADLPPADRDWARLTLAFEQTRIDHSNGLPWQTPLARARGEVHVPRAATLFGRFLASLRPYAVLGGVLTAASIFFALWR